MPTYTRDGCPACGSPHYKVMGKIDREKSRIQPPEDSHISICLNCDMIYVNPMPYWDKEDFQFLYGEGYFQQLSPRWLNARENIIPKKRFRLVEKYLQNKDKSLLEVGAGVYGFMCRFIVNQGWDVTAQEPSEAFHKELKKADERINCISTPYLDIPLNRQYAFIYADSVFEHVPNPPDYFSKSYDLLQPGGVLYFVSPNEHSLTNKILTWKNKSSSGIARALCPYYDSFHLVGYSKKSVQILCQKSGFELVRFIRHYDWRWLHDLETVTGPTKYPRVVIRYLVDFLGYGSNLEILLRKSV